MSIFLLAEIKGRTKHRKSIGYTARELVRLNRALICDKRGERNPHQHIDVASVCTRLSLQAPDDCPRCV